MRRPGLVLALGVGLCACHGGRAAAMSPQAALPASGDSAVARLNASPRHGEWVTIRSGAADSIRAWVSYPERSGRAPVVVVIHEIFGLSDWIRGVADQLAADGFIAVAPDLLSGKGPNGADVNDPQEAVRLIRTLTQDEIRSRLIAAAAYGRSLPAARLDVATVGFCWGGGTSFLAATYVPGLKGAVVYYGVSPDSATLAGVAAPVLGLYGGDDARVTSTVAPARAELQRLGRRYEAEIYAGAGHGFLRDQAGREGANGRAAAQAWPRTVAFLRQVLGR